MVPVKRKDLFKLLGLNDPLLDIVDPTEVKPPPSLYIQIHKSEKTKVQYLQVQKDKASWPQRPPAGHCRSHRGETPFDIFLRHSSIFSALRCTSRPIWGKIYVCQSPISWPLWAGGEAGDSFPTVNQSHQSIHPLNIVDQMYKCTKIQIHKYTSAKYKNKKNTKIVFPLSINSTNQSTPRTLLIKNTNTQIQNMACTRFVKYSIYIDSFITNLSQCLSYILRGKKMN